MKKIKTRTVIALIIGGIITYFIFLFLRTRFNFNDSVLLLLFPVTISAVTALFSSDDLSELKKDIQEELDSKQLNYQNEIKVLKKEIINYIDNDRIVCHGTKYSFPKADRSMFWNEFLISATYKFILLGSTNKNWLAGGREQSDRFGEAIVKILSNDGLVIILSEDADDIKKEHETFIENYVLKKIKNIKNNTKLIEKFQNNFYYKTRNDLNFTAVVSDERLVILPRMNNKKSQEKCMVLELSQAMPEIYKNYLTDIEAVIDLASDKKFNV